MRHPSEVRTINPGDRFMGRSITGEPLYRPPRRGRKPEGVKPQQLEMPDALDLQPTSDVFPAGVRFYDVPPTGRNLSVSWRGGMLGRRQALTRVLDGEGKPIRQVTDRGTFGQYTGIMDIPDDPKWLDPNRVIRKRDRGKVRK